MKNALVALVTALAIQSLAVGSFAQTSKPATPSTQPTTAPSAPAATDPATAPLTKPATAPAARLARVTGEIVSIDPAAKTLVVKSGGKNPGKDMTFGVDERAAASLATLKVGDRVALRYTDDAGHLTAKTIAKAAAKKTVAAPTEATAPAAGATPAKPATP